MHVEMKMLRNVDLENLKNPKIRKITKNIRKIENLYFLQIYFTVGSRHPPASRALERGPFECLGAPRGRASALWPRHLVSDVTPRGREGEIQ